MKRHRYLYIIGALIFVGTVLFAQQEMQVGAVPESTKILIDAGHGGK